MLKTTSIKKDITLPTLLLLAEVVLFAVLAVCSSRHFGLADGARITAAYLVAYLVPRIILTRARGTSIACQVILLLLAALLIYIDYSRLKFFTFFDGYSLQEPNLLGDGRTYYKWALYQYDGRIEPFNVMFPGFPMMMVVLWKIFGLSVVWPQAMNLMFTMTTVVLTGMTTRRLLSHRVKAKSSSLLACGMLLACMLTYFLVMSTTMLKEGTISLSMALAGFTLSSLESCDEERHHLRRDIFLFVLACVLLALVRTTYLYFIIIGVLLLALCHWRNQWRLLALMLCVIVLCVFLGNYFAYYSFERHVEIAGGGWNMQRFYVIGESQQFYHDLLNYYFLRPVWYKVLMLPLTMSVQFFIPLPWSYYDNPTFVNNVARLTYLWYFVGGTALFYYFVLSWRRNERLGVWTWWPALAFAALAYLMAGSVARYVVPILSLFVPVSVYVLCRVHEGHRRKAYLWWMVTLVIVIALVLLLCLEIQQGTFSKMLGTQSLVNYWKGLPY